MAHITLSQLATVLRRIVSWATRNFAAKNAGTGILDPSQWPEVMLYNVVPISPLDSDYDWSGIPVGSIYLEDRLVSGTPYRKLFKKTSVEQSGIVDMGMPQPGTIYCHVETGNTYRWDQSLDQGLGQFVKIGSNGEDGVGTVTGIKMNGTVMGNSGVVDLGDVVTDVSGKADLVDQAVLDPSQWPRVLLYSIDPDLPPKDAALGDIIVVKNTATGKLELRLFHGTGSEVILGEPVYGIIYIDKQTGNLYRWDQEWIPVGSLLDDRGKIPYSAMPITVLDSMNYTYNGDLITMLDKTVYCTDGKIRHFYRKTDDISIVARSVEYEPQKGIIYVHKGTGKFYCWDANAEEWYLINRDVDLGLDDKADLQPESKMLVPDQWPKTVLRNVTDTVLDDLAIGDVYYDSGHIFLHKSDAEDIDLGTPSKDMVYANKDTDTLYRWNGTRFVLLSSGGSSQGDGGDQPAEESASSAYVIDLQKFGITEGIVNKGNNGHYSESQYTVMYNNAVGFTRALEYARDNGYSKVLVPKGDYCFTPVYNVGNTPASVDLNPPLIWILNTVGLEFDLGGSTFHLMVDSTQKSRYYNINSSSTVWYKATMIGVGQSKNITIKNGVFRGDWYTRSFTNANEKKQESCYGISVGIAPFTFNVKLEGLEGSGFSGDFITSNPRSMRVYTEPFWDGRYNSNSNPRVLGTSSQYVKGVKNFGFGWRPDNYDIVKQSNMTDSGGNKSNNRLGLSGLHKVGSWCMDSKYPEYVRKEAAKRNFSLHGNLGYTRVINAYAPHVQVLTYASGDATADTKPLRIIDTGYCENFHLYDNETYVRFQFLNENGLLKNEYRISDTDDDKVDAYFGGLSEDETGDTDAPGGTDPSEVLPDDDIEDPEFSEDTLVSDVGNPGPKMHVVVKLNENVFIEKCYIHDNGRGGAGGGACNVVMRNCIFGKQQYNTTSADQGALPVFTVDNTNYHIDFEDAASNHCTIEGCTFFSGQNTGKLLFPTIMRLDFRNNICYGCNPAIGNCFVANIDGNKFYDTSVSSSYSNWGHNVSSVPKSLMRRVLNYTNNTYISCSAPTYSVRYNTYYNIKNCYIEIRDNSNVEPAHSKAIMSGFRLHRHYDNCHIKFLSNSTAYFETLTNSYIEGGTNWYVNRIENCRLNNSAFKLCGSDGNGSDTIHLYAINVQGMNLLSQVAAPNAKERNKDSNGNITDPRYKFVVHFVGCDISLDNISSSFCYPNYMAAPKKFAWHDGAKWYKDITYRFEGCVLHGKSSNQSGAFSAINDITDAEVYHDITAGKYYIRKSVADGATTLAASDAIDFANLAKAGIDYTYTEGDAESTAVKVGSSTETHEVATGVLNASNPATAHLEFDRCDFEIDGDYIFNFTMPSNKMYFVFSDNRVSAKLAKGSAGSAAPHIPDAQSGSSAERPWFTRQGAAYFDTTLGKVIYRKTSSMALREFTAAGLEFVDATGANV